MTYASTVPAALTALAAMLRLALPGVEVTDGPPLGNPSVLEAVSIGWSPSEDVDAAEVTTTQEGLGGIPDRETILVHCSVNVLSGDRDLTAARTRAYELHAAAGAALAADPQLRGSVMSAAMGDHSLRQSDTDTGMLARVNFTIRVDAYTRR